MPDFNQFIQMGRLTRDPELRYTGTGTAVAAFCVATTTQYGKESHQKDQAFVNWSFFGKRAERLVEYFRKGDPIFIKGRLKTNTWESQGQNHSRLEAVGEDWKFVGDTQQKRSDRAASYNAPAPVQATPPPASGIQPPSAPYTPAPDDDIPF